MATGIGLDATFIKNIDWALALKRISQDVRTDFIHAPHISAIYAQAGEALVEQVKHDLKAGTYRCGEPVTVEVPKTFRIAVADGKRNAFGPNYSRPGSILLPSDRLFYQALADEAVPVIDKATDHDRSFSHRLVDASSPAMFHSSRSCWNELQEVNREHARTKGVKFVLRVDIANFFGSLNQHKLINVLIDRGYPTSLANKLEEVLLGYTGQRNSRGILQGMYPSDLFGNFYLAPVDQFLKDDLEVPSTRYVDDLYIFLNSIDASVDVVRSLIPMLRSYDLILNEAKSKILPAKSLLTEEPDLEELFSAAFDEAKEQLTEEEMQSEYGFQSEWDGDDDDDDDEKRDELELAATQALFDSIDDYPGSEENIERFCLPLFARAGSNYAVEHVLKAFSERPSMSQIYAAYLAGFLDSTEVKRFLAATLKDDSTMDWQRMWVLAALMKADGPVNGAVKNSVALLESGERHNTLRASAAIYAGRFGDHTTRIKLGRLYSGLPAYIQLAIYYSSRGWPLAEKRTAKSSWGDHSTLHMLLTTALGAKKQST
jgi:Reverse transcriptase (RNA-dependent DNA polymerase)